MISYLGTKAPDGENCPACLEAFKVRENVLCHDDGKGRLVDFIHEKCAGNSARTGNRCIVCRCPMDLKSILTDSELQELADQRARDKREADDGELAVGIDQAENGTEDSAVASVVNSDLDASLALAATLQAEGGDSDAAALAVAMAASRHDVRGSGAGMADVGADVPIGGDSDDAALANGIAASLRELDGGASAGAPTAPAARVHAAPIPVRPLAPTGSVPVGGLASLMRNSCNQALLKLAAVAGVVAAVAFTMLQRD